MKHLDGKSLEDGQTALSVGCQYVAGQLLVVS